MGRNTREKRQEKREKNRLPEKQSSLAQGFEPKTEKQSLLYKTIRQKEVTIVKGIPGSGKTFCSLAAALNLLGQVYKKIIIVKSVTTLPDESIGFLKGGLSDKMEPFMFSFKWNVDKICGENSFDNLIDKKIIEILPLAYIRGITIDDAIVIFDELQNTPIHTFRTMMSRIGSNVKYVLLGDTEQIDLKRKQDSCLQTIFDLFKDEDFVGTVEFTDEDCVRNPIIPLILNKLRENGI